MRCEGWKIRTVTKDTWKIVADGAGAPIFRRRSGDSQRKRGARTNQAPFIDDYAEGSGRTSPSILQDFIRHRRVQLAHRAGHLCVRSGGHPVQWAPQDRLGRYSSSSWPAHIEAIDLARRYPNVYVDTSGIGSLKYLEMAAHELPPEKILFGTCAPEHDPRVEKEALRLLMLKPDAYAKVAGANILRLMGLQPGR
jgi:Amidohydrolase